MNPGKRLRPPLNSSGSYRYVTPWVRCAFVTVARPVILGVAWFAIVARFAFMNVARYVVMNVAWVVSVLVARFVVVIVVRFVFVIVARFAVVRVGASSCGGAYQWFRWHSVNGSHPIQTVDKHIYPSLYKRTCGNEGCPGL